MTFGMASGKVDGEFSFAAFRLYILVPFIFVHNAQFRFGASSTDQLPFKTFKRIKWYLWVVLTCVAGIHEGFL
jgi:hypothetical protein